jgi:hypothetical protein
MRRLRIMSDAALAKAETEPLTYLNDVMSAWSNRPGAKPVFGFKMMLHHDQRVIDHLLETPDWRVILLRRDNALAQWSSLQIAKVTGDWGGKKKQALVAAGIDVPDPRIEFDARAFEAHCSKLDARYASIRQRIGKRALFEVATESIDARRDEILEFLGVDPSLAKAAPGAGQRQNTTSLEERFSNPGAVRDYARSHGLQLIA